MIIFKTSFTNSATAGLCCGVWLCVLWCVLLPCGVSLWCVLRCVLCVSVGVWFHFPENCTLRPLVRVFSVPGDVAMLNSTLLSPNVFNYTALPYNISWYDPLNGTEMVNQTARFLLRGETLWHLNVALEDAGDYVCVVRYSFV